MPGKAPGEIRVAGTGTISRAPLGTTLPTDGSTALAAAFVDLGYAADGFKVKQDFKTDDIMSWQSLEAVRIVPTGLIRTFTFTLQQTNAVTLALAWGGATIVNGATGTGKYTLDVPAANFISESAWAVDWSDGVTSQRLVIPRGALTSLPEIEFKNDGAVTYEFEVRAVVPSTGGDAVLAYGTDTAVNAS